MIALPHREHARNYTKNKAFYDAFVHIAWLEGSRHLLPECTRVNTEQVDTDKMSTEQTRRGCELREMLLS